MATRAGAGITIWRRATGSTAKAAAGWPRATGSSSKSPAASVRCSPATGSPELNWENSGRDDRNGAAVADTGGWELFLSPGLFATYRNVALRTGVQIPIAHGLNGTQPESDYRFKVEIKYAF